MDALYFTVFFGLGIALIVVVVRVLTISAGISRRARRANRALEVGRLSDDALCHILAVADGLRYRKLDLEAASAPLRDGAEQLRGLARVAESFDRSVGRSHGPTSLAGEIQRAERAAELVEHGRALLSSGTREDSGEGETSIKRGYLNLLHARDAIRERAEDVATAARKRS
jgi:hypothetical protein